MTENQLTPDLRTRLYTSMVLTRKFEEKIVTLSQEPGRMPGMQILANGQEAVATGIVSALEPADVIISNHRSHGHLLARGRGSQFSDGRDHGQGHGRQRRQGRHPASIRTGSQHIDDIHGWSVPALPWPLGAAFAQQYKRTTGITVVFFGDGAAAEGSVHEAMNLAGGLAPAAFVRLRKQLLGRCPAA